MLNQAAYANYRLAASLIFSPNGDAVIIINKPIALLNIRGRPRYHTMHAVVQSL